MCGIAGIVSLDGACVDPAALRAMANALAHRGPDDAGFVFLRPGSDSGEGGGWCEFVDPAFKHKNEHLPVFGGPMFREELALGGLRVGLAHRRLSIIDVTHRGHQPMPSSDRRLWVTYNGEIYNFPELRRDLEAQGHVFRTRSDTEVLLHLWEEHGPACLERLDGMFALAMFDRAAGTLTLARDRFGVKPLYCCESRDGAGARWFTFASEVKGVLASGLVPRRLDPDSLVEYLTFQNIFGDGTLIEGVRMLAPGSTLTLNVSSGEHGQAARYFRGFPAAEPGLTADLHEQVADAFANAVKRQLISDVEVGSYLSGGMDSGSIVAIAGRSIPRLLTFTGGFDLTNVNGIEQGFDERRAAESLSHLLQTEHYDVVLHAGDMPAAMERISWHMDDPRVGMCHQNWYVAKLASKFVKVCLAGAGGDELFGGYPWRYRRGTDAKDFAGFDSAYYAYWHRLLEPGELPRLFAPEFRERLGATRESFAGVMKDAPAYDERLGRTDNLVQRALHFEFRTFLPGFLVTEDRMSMAHSLETRVPFLDNALADLAWRIPPSAKVEMETLIQREQKKHMATAEGKRVLRRAMERFLPAEFTRQAKQGFSPPDENWYRGPSMEYIQSVLRDKRTLERPWFERGFVEGCLREHFDGRRNHRLLIWSLLSVEWLQRHFVDGPVKVAGAPAEAEVAG